VSGEREVERRRGSRVKGKSRGKRGCREKEGDVERERGGRKGKGKLGEKRGRVVE